LTNTVFSNPIPTGADFTAADARGAVSLETAYAITTNLIRPDGHIDGVDLSGLLVVGDYDGDTRLVRGWPPGQPSPVTVDPIPITIDQHLAISPGGTLRMV